METNIPGAAKDDNSVDRGPLVERALRYLSVALETLGVAHAITGKAVGFEKGLNRAPQKIYVGLLDSNPLIYSEIVEKQVATLTFEDDRQMFYLNPPHPLFFADERLMEGKCEVVFFRVDDLPHSTHAQFSSLFKSKYGSPATSPIFFFLEYILETARMIQICIMFGDTRISHGTSTARSSKSTLICSPRVSKMLEGLSAMLERLKPGNPSDERFIEEKHCDSIRYLSRFLPNIVSFLPFRPVFFRVTQTIKEETNSEGNIASLRSSSPLPIPRPSVTKPSTDSSLRWAADAVMEVVWGLGFPVALTGEMANVLHGAQSCPTHVDVLIFPASFPSQIDKDAVKQSIALADPANFVLVDSGENPGYSELYYQPAPTTLAKMDFEFSIGSKLNHWERCRIKIILSTKPPVSNVMPAWTHALVKIWPHIKGLSVTPFYLTLLFQLNLWHKLLLEESPKRVQAAETIYQLLHQHLKENDQCFGVSYRPIYSLWSRCPFWTPGLQESTQDKITAYIACAALGPLSMQIWIKLGWYPATPTADETGNVR